MSRQFKPSLNAMTRPAGLGLAPRAVAFVGLVAVLVGCGEQSAPTSPATSAGVAPAHLTSAAVIQSELMADAIGRILPALEKDAAAPVGNALRTLDARLSDPNAATDARTRAVATVQNVLGQFNDPLRADAADLDAMRLEVDEIERILR